MTAQTDRTRRSFAMEEAVAILARTPAALTALLRDLPDGWIAANEGGDLEPLRCHRTSDSWRANRLAAARQNHPGARRNARVRDVRSFRAVRTLAGAIALQSARRVRGAAPGQPQSARRAARDRRESRSTWAASTARRGDAAAAARHLGGTRPRSRRADLTSAGQAVLGRSRPVASLSAHHQRNAGVTILCSAALMPGPKDPAYEWVRRPRTTTRRAGLLDPPKARAQGRSAVGSLWPSARPRAFIQS
jgi:hypothetical protein